MFPYPPEPSINKNKWLEGPWKTEPDTATWVDPETSLNCAMIRHSISGAWAGYVAVDPLHPLHLISHRDLIPIPKERRDRSDFSVTALMTAILDQSGARSASLSTLLPAHGSLNYAAEDSEGFWWFGFDCMRAWDIMPAVFDVIPNFWSKQVYRDHGYVHDITTKLASAIEELSGLMKIASCTD